LGGAGKGLTVQISAPVDYITNEVEMTKLLQLITRYSNANAYHQTGYAVAA
jgi:hypothetical protein